MSGFLSVLVSYGATAVKDAYQKIIASDTASQTGANFGSAVALSGNGNYIVVGSALAGSADDGAVYVYYNNSGTWEEQAKLVASNAVVGDWFGCAVDITKTGDRIIVGAQKANALPYNQDNSGAAYIFQRSGTTWTEELYLPGGNGGSNDYWGNSVAINDNGTAIFVGAYGDEGDGTNVGFVHTFLIKGNTWAGLKWNTDDDMLPTSATESNSHHGWSVACNANGERCIEGGPGDNNQGKTNSGVVTIHRRSLGGVVGWRHVSYSAWGSFMNKYAIWTGAYTSGATRSISATINFPITGLYSIQVAADNKVTWTIDGADSTVYSGYAGSTTVTRYLSAGDHILSMDIYNGIGTEGNPAGAGFRITKPDGTELWTTLDLINTPWTRDIWLEPPYPSNDGQFGWSVAMDAIGDRVVIGAIGESPTGIASAGAAYIYKRTGTVWALEAQLTADAKEAGDKFGYSVSINAAGDKVTVGTIYANIPTKAAAGVVYVFERSSSIWTQSSKLTAGDAEAGDNLGSAVSLNDAGTGVVVGSLGNDPFGSIDSGAAYYFPLVATVPFVPSDPHWNNVELLVTADNGIQGSNTFVDLSNNNLPLTTHGSVVIDTNIKKFGSGSINVPNVAGNYISTPLTTKLGFSSGAFTVEAWIYPTRFDTNDHGCIIICDTWELAVDNASHNGRLTFYYTNTAAVYGPNVPLNQWSHVAAVYDGTEVTVYVNGIPGIPKAITGLTANVNVNQIGGHGTWQYTGYIDELRVTKGVARYSGTFTPPTDSFYS